VREPDSPTLQALEMVLGHLNFASGTANAKVFTAINEIFRFIEKHEEEHQPWQVAEQLLLQHLERLKKSSAAFADATQASQVLELLFRSVLPSYLEFHSDLLFHQQPAELFNSFFLGHAMGALLLEGAPWHETMRITKGTLRRLNDFIGYRPVATLESQKIQPYTHEWVRTVPLYIDGAGAAVGRYEQVVTLALDLLRRTEADTLRAAHFDPALLTELAFDPRAYDFDHPANKRPNHHFGQWDPHFIDGRGNFRRFVVQQVTLDSLMQRLEGELSAPFEEIQLEAAAVLAGTILMASGICGSGPDSHDSTVSLATLLPRIARYRDAFYEHLLASLTGNHAQRLKQEAAEKRQPFGGARQHLNAQLARRRAAQLEHVHVAQIYARMGFPVSAHREANVVPCASARMLCHVDCLLSAVDLALEHKQLHKAAEQLPVIVNWIQRAIECGATVDPWNILGFDAQFSLFPSAENSVRDHRVDDLIGVMEQTFSAHARVWSEAAAVDDDSIGQFVALKFKDLANWWHKFAVHEVASVEAMNPLDVFRAAEHVVNALHLWHKGNTATGDIKFWASHTRMFNSPKAYALVVEALLERGDLIASQALLIHWLSQAETIGLVKADVSFHALVERWFFLDAQQQSTAKQAFRFIDLLEANAEHYWRVPDFQLDADRFSAPPRATTNSEEHEEEEDEEDEEDEEEDTFHAAYEDMVYRDSTDDGVEGQVFDPSLPSHDEFVRESKRITERLDFLSLLARLWRQVAIRKIDHATVDLQHYAQQARMNYEGLMALLNRIKAYRLPKTSGDHDSMLEYDRVRLARETLLDRVIHSAVETADAYRLFSAAATAGEVSGVGESDDTETLLMREVFSLLMRGEVAEVRGKLQEVMTHLAGKPLLYVPVAKGGDPRAIVQAKARQHVVEDLLIWLPRCGLLLETCQLIETAREMERSHSVGPGAVTEFDELFKVGYRAVVEALVESSKNWGAPEHHDADDRDSSESALVECLEQLTESILVCWLAHSRTLRLSVLERVQDKKSWSKLVEFIERFGAELFTQRFLNLGNARAILHQGASNWLKRLLDDPPDDAPQELLAAIESSTTAVTTSESKDVTGKQYTLAEIAEQLTIVLESVVENYGEYRDYNSTTTQSDRGELLYMLLDFLRLRTKYDRVCWNLKPVVIAHDILVRRGHDDAARMWRRALIERISDEANQYLQQLGVLQKQYAMRMPTVADRLNERFIRPLAIDRIRALVSPAIQEARSGGEHPLFELLEEEIDLLAKEPTGVGLDVPIWIVALEEEVDRVRHSTQQHTWEHELKIAIPQTMLTLDDTQSQIDAWTSR
jgi:hypothetical protein